MTLVRTTKHDDGMSSIVLGVYPWPVLYATWTTSERRFPTFGVSVIANPLWWAGAVLAAMFLLGG